jgi:hypothetical protein
MCKIPKMETIYSSETFGCALQGITLQRMLAFIFTAERTWNRASDIFVTGYDVLEKLKM